MSTAQDLRTAAINDVGPVGEVVSYGSHLHPEWFSGRVPLLGTLLYTAPPAQAKEIEGLKAALTQVRKCLETANDLGNIIDTIWMPSRPETLFDFIDAAIAQQKETP